MQVRVFEESELKGTGDIEWIANDVSDWKLDLTTPLGQTLVRIKRQRKEVSAIGMYKEQIPEINVREDGFLEIDGNLVGLKPGEIPCILKNTLPQSWMADLYMRGN